MRLTPHDYRRAAIARSLTLTDVHVAPDARVDMRKPGGAFVHAHIGGAPVWIWIEGPNTPEVSQS